MFLPFLNRVVIICTTFNITNIPFFPRSVLYMILRKIPALSLTSMNRLVRLVVADCFLRGTTEIFL